MFFDADGYCSDTIYEDLCGDIADTNSNICNLLKDDPESLSKIIRFVNEYKDKMSGVCTVDFMQEIWHCPFVREMVELLDRYKKEDFYIYKGNVDD